MASSLSPKIPRTRSSPSPERCREEGWFPVAAVAGHPGDRKFRRPEEQLRALLSHFPKKGSGRVAKGGF